METAVIKSLLFDSITIILFMLIAWNFNAISGLLSYICVFVIYIICQKNEIKQALDLVKPIIARN